MILPDRAALADLADQLQRLDADIYTLEQQRAAVREQIGLIVAVHGTQDVPGVGRFALTQPGVTVTYPARAIDDLVRELHTAGEHAIATQLTDLRQERERAGSLRLTRPRAS